MVFDEGDTERSSYSRLSTVLVHLFFSNYLNNFLFKI